MENLGNSNKKMIIIILCIIFLIIIGIICLIFFQKNNEELENIELDQYTDEDIKNSWKQTFEEVESYDIYYSIKNILNNYVTRIKEVNGDQYIDFGRLQQLRDEAISSLKEESITSIYNMFDSQYIEESNVTEETVRTLAQKYMQQGDYSQNITYDLQIQQMYVADVSTQMSFVLVDFMINETEDSMIIKLDLENSTYSVFGQEYLYKKGYDENTEVANMDINQNAITSNDYNQFDFVNTNDKYVINQYFSEYQTELLTNIEGAYNLLDKDFRENKYENYQEFETYVQEKYDILQNMYLDKYLINQFDEYKEYVCLDENNNYYIFIERSLTDYSVVLDTYTIDLKDFTDKYNSADESTKVGMNVEKVIEAINDKDYRYVYNKLDETFRNNNFGNLENFSIYMNENFYENNEMEYLEFSEEGDIYIYNAKLKNTQEEDSEKKDITIIMKLLEGTDFVMSFSME